MNQKTRSTPRQKLFVVLMLLLPFAFLGTVELGLRLVGFGGDYPLFVESKSIPGALEANAKVGYRYMATPGEPFAKIDPIPFRKDKPADTYRIVVQGGSSAAGYPYGRWAGLAGMLGDRLEATFPDGNVEVITTAMAAVNSYTLLDFAEEIVEIKPDAVLIYAGHNEYVGVLGVGSALTSSGSQAMARLQLEARKLRLYQCLEWLMTKAKVAARLLSGDRSSFFAKTASGAKIPYGSDKYLAGIRQFEGNLDNLLARYAQAGIPVYIGTLVSNEKDLQPFVGDPEESVDRNAWSALMEEQEMLRATGDFVAARNVVEQLLALDPMAADVWFALGELEIVAGRPGEARKAFVKAKDLDRLRFRAPSDFEESIRHLAARHGATIVEVEDRFRENSPESIIGRELVLEHVHPDGEGYFLLADTYYEALRSDSVIGDWSKAPTRDEARADMPLTEIDRLLGHYDVLELMAGPPFTNIMSSFTLPEPSNEIERLAQRLRAGKIERKEALEVLLQIHRSQGRTADAARVARVAAHEFPMEHQPSLNAGLLLAQLERHTRARLYLEHALRILPNDTSTIAALVKVNLAIGDRERAEKHLMHLKTLVPEHPLVLLHSLPDVH